MTYDCAHLLGDCIVRELICGTRLNFRLFNFFSCLGNGGDEFAGLCVQRPCAVGERVREVCNEQPSFESVSHSVTTGTNKHEVFGAMRIKLERVMRFELTTSTLARLRSTPELHPHPDKATQFICGWPLERKKCLKSGLKTHL